MIKLLYFSINEWGNLGRRKPRIAYELARQPEVASVLYVEPPVETSFLDLARGRFAAGHLDENHNAHRSALLGHFRLVVDNLFVYTGSTKTVPLTRLKAIRQLDVIQRINQYLFVGLIRHCLRKLPGDRLIIWLNYPLQARFIKSFPDRALLCYDWTDDWTAFDELLVEKPQELHDLTDHLLREADVIFTVSEELQKQAKARNQNIYRSPNATDFDLLGIAGNTGPVAPELHNLTHPIIGYIGQIADKMDFHLINTLTRIRPEWSFVFVGPVWKSKKIEVDNLSSLPNIHFLGPKPYEELLFFLRGFDVCMIPHQCNRLTESMDPIKLYDYLASGKPIVSTHIAGADRFADVVRIVDDATGFVDAIEQALVENDNLRDRRVNYARHNSWPARVSEIWEVITDQLAAKEGDKCQPSVL